MRRFECLRVMGPGATKTDIIYSKEVLRGLDGMVVPVTVPRSNHPMDMGVQIGKAKCLVDEHGMLSVSGQIRDEATLLGAAMSGSLYPVLNGVGKTEPIGDGVSVTVLEFELCSISLDSDPAADGVDEFRLIDD